jgi:cytidylate kinase
VRAYRDNDNGIIVGTLATLQEGLDGLQVGSQAAFIEQHTLDAMNAQAIARLIRTGQRQPVLAYWLYAPKTFDVRVRRLAKSRKRNIDEALREFLEEEEWKK